MNTFSFVFLSWSSLKSMSLALSTLKTDNINNQASYVKNKKRKVPVIASNMTYLIMDVPTIDI